MWCERERERERERGRDETVKHIREDAANWHRSSTSTGMTEWGRLCARNCANDYIFNLQKNGMCIEQNLS